MPTRHMWTLIDLDLNTTTLLPKDALSAAQTSAGLRSYGPALAHYENRCPSLLNLIFEFK